MLQHGGRRCREGDDLAWLPGDTVGGAEAPEQRQEVGVLAMHDMRPNIDFVAARRMTPAARAAAELRAALEHKRTKAAFRQGYRAG